MIAMLSHIKGEREFVLPVDNGAKGESALPRVGHVFNLNVISLHLILAPMYQLGHEHSFIGRERMGRACVRAREQDKE